MKKISLFYSLFAFIVLSVLGYQGCSKFDNTVTQAPEINTHPHGWANPTSANFHGKYIVDNKQWNLNQCKSCHGNDYSGGTANSSCLGCHNSSGGPENCRLCHGNSDHANPPKGLTGDTSTSSLGVGVHVAHVNSPDFSAALHCTDCHSFSGFSDPNHIGNSPDGIAEINFGTLANDTLLGGVHPDPSWNRNTATCSNVYCHGAFKGGNSAAGIWTDPKSVVCGSCHGDPTTGNPTPRTNGIFTAPHFSFMTKNTCYICHGTVINPLGDIIDKTKHVNGEINY